MTVLVMGPVPLVRRAVIACENPPTAFVASFRGDGSFAGRCFFGSISVLFLGPFLFEVKCFFPTKVLFSGNPLKHPFLIKFVR